MRCGERAEGKDDDCRPLTGIVADTVTGTFRGAWSAVQMPFEDLNIKRQKIPGNLSAIADNPYALPAQMLCEGLRKEIMELDAVLGPDICTQQNPTGITISRKGEYIEQGAGLVRDQAVGMVSGKLDVIPFRGVVRRISGAAKHAREVERAYEAGRLRRAYLKGVAAGISPDCLYPAPDANYFR